MNLTKKLSFVLATFVAASLLHADEPATPDTSVGTLGQRYGELGFTDQVIKHISNNSYDGELAANVPVTRFLDLGGSYTYSWFKYNNQNLHSNIAQGDATAYTTAAGMKPFVTASIGYQWDRTTSTNFFIRSDYGFWSGTAGVEIPFGPVALTPFASYDSDFLSSAKSSQDLNFGLKANYWFNDRWAGFVDVYYDDAFHSIYDSTVVSIGVRRRF
ncbi:MAG: hypothetical protein ABSE59_09305 [Opitutaceae bacterium]|jgi:hypothetical protein